MRPRIEGVTAAGTQGRVARWWAAFGKGGSRRGAPASADYYALSMDLPALPAPSQWAEWTPSDWQGWLNLYGGAVYALAVVARHLKPSKGRGSRIAAAFSVDKGRNWSHRTHVAIVSVQIDEIRARIKVLMNGGDTNDDGTTTGNNKCSLEEAVDCFLAEQRAIEAEDDAAGRTMNNDDEAIRAACAAQMSTGGRARSGKTQVTARTAASSAEVSSSGRAHVGLKEEDRMVSAQGHHTARAPPNEMAEPKWSGFFFWDGSCTVIIINNNSNISIISMV